MTREQWLASAEALLDLDAKGALVPHGIGGHARTLLEEAIRHISAVALPAQNLHESQTVSEEMVELIAISYHEAESDNDTVPWERCKSNYRGRVRKMVRTVLRCNAALTAALEPSHVTE